MRAGAVCSLVASACIAVSACGGASGASETTASGTPETAGTGASERETPGARADTSASGPTSGAAPTSATAGQTRAGPTAAPAGPDATARAPEAEPPSPLSPSQRVETQTDRAEMSAFLIEPARKAAKAKRWGRAIALYEAAVVARGPGSPAALELARAWLGAGQHAEARAALVDVAARATDDALRADARADLERLAQLDEPAARGLSLPRLNREARAAYQRGREAFRRKRYADALVYFEMGNALDPDQAGYLREIGATYDKLGLADDKRDFFLDHLRQRPFGQGATYLRKALGAKRLGTLTITTSLPCDEVWLNGQRVTGRLPLRKLAAAPGRYKALCVSYEYEIAYFEYARVTAGQAAELAFRWALIVNELRDPFGRIAIENARDATVMMDLGISSPEVGVIIPADGRALRMLLKDDAGTRVEERFVTLTAGQRLVIKW